MLVSPIDRSDIDSVAPDNPLWWDGDGINVHYHTAAERFPYRDTSLAVHLARFSSTVMALVTIVCTYFMTRLIVPRQALVAAAIVAFNPQFIFISSAVTNDTLVTALSALALAILVWLVIRPQAGLGPYVLLGAIWGLATLAKLSGLALGLLIGVGIITIAWRFRSWQLLFKGSIGAALGIALTAGWWFLRNWSLYGDPLAWQELLLANRFMVREGLLSLRETLEYAYGLRQSFWAMFGYGIPGPSWFYLIVNGIMLLSLIGLAIWLVRKLRDKEDRARLLAALLLIGWTILVGLLLMRWIRQVLYTNQGRLLFPAISSLAAMIAIGLSTLSGRRNWISFGLITFLATWAVAAPLIIIRPAYQQPRLLADEADIPNPVTVTFDGKMGLLGYDLAEQSIGIGQHPAVDLYWQAQATMDESYVVVLTAKDANGRSLAKVETVPYDGRFQTPIWPLNQPFRDRYILPAIDAEGNPWLHDAVTLETIRVAGRD